MYLIRSNVLGRRTNIGSYICIRRTHSDYHSCINSLAAIINSGRWRPTVIPPSLQLYYNPIMATLCVLRRSMIEILNLLGMPYSILMKVGHAISPLLIHLNGLYACSSCLRDLPLTSVQPDPTKPYRLL